MRNKFFAGLFFLLMMPTSFACDEDKSVFVFPAKAGGLMLDASQVVRALAKEEALKDLKKKKLNDGLKYVAISRTKPEVFNVFGFTEKEILDMVNDSTGAACSEKNIHDNMANRWCHGSVVKFIDGNLKNAGLNKLASQFLAASVFVPKEYLIDLHPSKADLVISDFEVYKSQDAKGSREVTITLFGDRMYFVTLKNKF